MVKSVAWSLPTIFSSSPITFVLFNHPDPTIGFIRQVVPQHVLFAPYLDDRLSFWQTSNASDFETGRRKVTDWQFSDSSDTWSSTTFRFMVSSSRLWRLLEWTSEANKNRSKVTSLRNTKNCTFDCSFWRWTKREHRLPLWIRWGMNSKQSSKFLMTERTTKV